MRQFKIQKSITPRENKSLTHYLQDISNEDMISPEEEVALAMRIKQGDEQALNKLTRANLRFVVSVAKQYQHQGLSLPDLINEGNMGLIKAAHKFDETKGFKFISYAVWWIRQSIMQAIRRNARVIRVPENKLSQINKIRDTINRYEQRNERPPDPAELAEMVEVPYHVVRNTLEASMKEVSFDAPVRDEEDYTLINTIENRESPKPDDQLERQSLLHELEKSFKKLNNIERRIIKCSYGIGTKQKTLNEMEDELNLSKVKIGAIRQRAIRKLRSIPECKILKTYL